ETAMAGRKATVLIEGERRVDVVVRFPEASRSDAGRIGKLLLTAPGGERVPLDSVAEFTTVEAPAQVSRENGMRRVVTEANVRGRDMGGFVRDVQVQIAPLVDGLPSGYWVEYGGQFENQQRAMRQLSIVLPIALLLIVVLLYLALGNLGDAMLVLINLPFALVGGVIAVVIFGMPLSVSASIAFIVLLAIAVQNGVVLVSFIRQLRLRGATVVEAVREGCDLRFRPLLMTALTSFLGHLPMFYATGSGADIQKPLAVVVNGGIVTSTILTLVVLPAVYLLVHGGGGNRRKVAPPTA
ncbi:MAG: efflux RND transporter permease subunit, partial [Coriobacteriia bacterium]|nr:efflux RND transporter permease subunit [Coriobacteriia bacterium]